jgi:cytidylate kinase
LVVPAGVQPDGGHVGRQKDAKERDMPIVTISRQYGAGGSSVAALVAAKLGADVLDKTLIDEVAARLALPATDVEHEEERPRSLLERLVRSFSSIEPGMGAGWTTPSPDSLFDPHKEIISLTQQLIREAAAGGKVVIVGRGAGFLLRDDPNVFRVYLHAPEAVRVRRLMQRFGLSEADAGRKMHETDTNRAAYIRQLYGHDWCDTEEYDLTIDTGRIGYDAAAEIILRGVAESASKAALKA